MSKFISRLKKIYEEEKDLENPPGYLEIIKEILEIDARLNENKNVSGGGWCVVGSTRKVIFPWPSTSTTTPTGQS